MPKFKDREEYERWKAERSRQSAQNVTAPVSEKETGLPGPGAPGVKRQTPDLPGGPSDIGELFSRSWDSYKRRFGPLIGLCLLMVVLFIFPLAVFGSSGFALALVFPDLKAVLIGVFLTIGFITSVVTLFWGMSGLLCAVTDESLSIREALGRGWSKVGGLIWLLSVLGFLTTGGFLLFFIPGVIFTVWFFFGQFVFIEDDERGMRALLKSREFVKGYGFDVFVRLLVIWLVSAVLGIVPLIGPILSFLFVPFVMIYSYLIYQDLKTLKGDVAFSATGGEKFKWLGTATLGYVLVPVLIVAIFGAALLSSFVFIKGMLSSPGVTVFAPHTQPADNVPQQQSDVVRPSNFNELLGTWSGREINGSPGWTFSFSDGYNVHAVGTEGWYRGKVGIHWKLGGDERGLQVPPGASVFDVDVTESSSGDYVGKISAGAFAIYGGTNLKLCSGEPGKTKRPESFDPVPGIKCFELTRTAAAPPPPQSSQGFSQSAPAPEASSMEDEETKAARNVYKRCVAAYRSGNIAEAKTYFSRTTLAEIERSGQADMAMGMLIGMNIDEFQSHREGNRITFKQSQKQGEATMSMSFAMVKEDNQWKLGN